MKSPRIYRALGSVALLLCGACADAPITAAQLQDDGQLRAGQSAAAEGSVALFSGTTTAPTTHEARNISLSAILETEFDEEPRERARALKRGEERAVSVRLRGEGLSGPLPVSIIWTRGDEQREQTAVVQAGQDFRVAARQDFAVESQGTWRVEVFALRAGDRDLMLAREFELTLQAT